jgi:hypothetical protein
MSDDGRGEGLFGWAHEPLPLYGIVAWTGNQRVGSQAGLGRLLTAGESRAVLMSASVVHEDGAGASLEVVSNRPDDTHFGKLRA